MAWENINIVVGDTTYSGQKQMHGYDAEFKIPASSNLIIGDIFSPQDMKVYAVDECKSSDNNMLHINAIT
tara:strand:- start:2012 stop:2221 length:210 start_codon:yes stop_codon:yes gene_type:complete